MNRKIPLLGLFFSLVFGVHASPVLVTTAGTFAAGTPTTAWTAAGDTWSVSFTLDSNPTVISSSPGFGFEAPLTSFVYKRNGAVVNVGPVDVEFFNAGQGGLFNLCFYGCSAAATNPFEGFAFSGGAVYTGTEAAPTIQNGTYVENFNAAFFGIQGLSEADQANGSVTIAAVAVPEPSSLLPLLAFCGALVLVRTTFSKKPIQGQIR